MKRWMMAAGAAALMAGTGPTPARADRIVTFVQTGGSQNPGPQGPFQGVYGGGTIVLTDDAYAAGVNLAAGSGPPGTPYVAMSGVVDFLFRTSFGGISLTLTLNDLLYPEPPTIVSPRHVVALSSAPGGLPTGTIRYSTDETSFSFTLGNPFGTASTASDAGGGCFYGCNITGFSTVSVPEPASLALFTAGLGGLVGLGRARRRGTAACPAPRAG